MAGPCQRLQDQVDELDSEIQDLIDALPDVPPSVRPGVLRQIAALRRRLIIVQHELTACLANPAPYILQQDAIEVTQAIQEPGNSVPLVAGKVTVVRVYLSYYNSPGISVRGTLRAQPAGGSAVVVPSIADVFLDPAQAGDTTSKRMDVGLSLNFALPSAVLASGQLTVSLGEVTDVATSALLHVAYATSVALTLDESHPLRVRVLSIRYTQQIQPPPAPLTTFVATANDLQHLQSWLGRAYPVAQVIWSSGTIDTNKPAPFTSGDINAQLAAIRAQDVVAGTDKRTHYYGIVSDGGFFMRGSAAGIPSTPDPSTVASGPTGPGNWGWDFDGSYGDWYGGHELGHTFGRFHPGSGCSESSDDPNYPYTHGQLANSNSSYVGFDVGDQALGIAITAYPGMSWHDVMTYCSSLWLSNYTYVGVKTRLAAEDALPAGPVPAAVTVAMGSSGGPPDRRFPSAPAPERETAALLRTHVVARVNLTRQEGTLEFVNPLPPGEPSELAPGSEVLLRVLRADDALVDERPVEVKLDSELGPRDDRTGLVDVALPVDSESRAIELVVG
ncbi:MAG: hypothetical protein JOZ81_13390, partial [Chloroflexi bacterium]|nr:hypothetical protein [Chloroflexota bacterium]